ncbi:MAG: radical SAM protein, partial [Deltaproteobacteria bacterium]|nr:radical SAM protein [Deltaproteobacteria bacterium]
TLLDEAALGRLGAAGLQVRLLVSLDGLPGVHDRSRGPGVEERALGVLRRAPALGVDAAPASILTTELLEYGIGRWPAWLGAALGRAAGLVLWPLFLGSGVPAAGETVGRPLGARGQEEAARQVALLLRAGADVTIVDGPTINPLLRRLGVESGKLWQCNAGRGRLCVQADGTLSPCHPCRLPLGRLEPGRTGGFIARALGRPEARRLAAREHDGCAGCEDRDVCGGCQAAVLTRGAPLFGTDELCWKRTAGDRPAEPQPGKE